MECSVCTVSRAGTRGDCQPCGSRRGFQGDYTGYMVRVFGGVSVSKPPADLGDPKTLPGRRARGTPLLGGGGRGGGKRVGAPRLGGESPLRDPPAAASGGGFPPNPSGGGADPAAARPSALRVGAAATGGHGPSGGGNFLTYFPTLFSGRCLSAARWGGKRAGTFAPAPPHFGPIPTVPLGVEGGVLRPPPGRTRPCWPAPPAEECPMAQRG